MIKIPGLPTYYGGKEASGVYQAIINQIPPHYRYFELFLGRGTILRLKKASEYSYGFEIDKTIYDKWHEIQLPENFIIENCCGIKSMKGLINFIGDNISWWKETFVYCDPPYLLTTRKTQRKTYKHELTVPDHIRLLDVANNLKCNVAISCYDNDLYAEHLATWRKIHFKAQTRQGTATETLYMNYPPPTELHDYRYIGSNYRERDRIQQKIKRHIQRLKRLPLYERQAIIEAIRTKI
jgi:DNA adenine methylase